MKTIEDAQTLVAEVGKNIEKELLEGGDPGAMFEGQIFAVRFKEERNDAGALEVVGGEFDGGNNLTVSERGVTTVYGDQIVGYAFHPDVRPILREFFVALLND